jgi:hypothetical protein
MNADTRHGRLAKLNPCDVKVVLESTKPAPCKPAAPWTAPLSDSVEVDAQFGCVDWYQYHHEAQETHVVR